MSDDRMDRATRIRNMREGNRGTDDDQTADGVDDEPDAASDPADAAGEHGQSESASGGDEGTASEPDTTERASLPTDDGTATDVPSASSQTADSAPTAADPSETVDSASTQTASETTEAGSEAMAAAERAAASAAEVMGSEASTAAEADTGDTTDAGAIPGEVNGVELPDRELLEAAMTTSSTSSTEGGARAAMGEESSQSEEVVRVLEFSLGDEYYCLDIEYVEEIVKRDAVTRVPNTPAFVDGVVDLRGQITTILEPKEMMNIESEGEQNLIIVFDPAQFEEQGAVGWVVDEVRQVVPVTESEINNPPVDADYINGVIDREAHEQFVIWIEPEDALTQATATDD